MEGGGTEAFPELGKHCQQSSCNQLDFLPFKCDACLMVSHHSPLFLSHLTTFLLSLHFLPASLPLHPFRPSGTPPQLHPGHQSSHRSDIQVYCLEHRSYKSHDCPKAEHRSRTVVVCSLCSLSIEREGSKDDKTILEQHQQSRDCNPSNNKKPTCPVKRCKQVLTFSNTTACKICHQKVCLKHRFPSDHACSNPDVSTRSKFLMALAARSSKACGQEKHMPSPPPPSVKAY